MHRLLAPLPATLAPAVLLMAVIGGAMAGTLWIEYLDAQGTGEHDREADASGHV